MRPIVVLLISALTLAGLLACTRGGAVARSGLGCTRVGCTTRPPGQAVGARASWRVSCRELCDVPARAETPEALCARVAGHGGACVGARPFALDAPEGAAITGGAILDVLRPQAGRDARGAITSVTSVTSVLAIRTQEGWRVVRGLGARVRLASAALADVPGFAPPAVRVRVIDDDAAATERLYVCGVRGDASVDCPVAIVSGAPGWRVEVELDGDRFVARPAVGEVPAAFRGLVGAHAMFEAR